MMYLWDAHAIGGCRATSVLRWSRGGETHSRGRLCHLPPAACRVGLAVARRTAGNGYATCLPPRAACRVGIAVRDTPSRGRLCHLPPAACCVGLAVGRRTAGDGYATLPVLRAPYFLRGRFVPCVAPGEARAACEATPGFRILRGTLGIFSFGSGLGPTFLFVIGVVASATR